VLLNKQERAKINYEQKHKIINGIETKKCRQCEEFLPMTTEYYFENKKFKDGFVAICKECTKEPEKRKSKAKGFNRYKIQGDTTIIFIDNDAGEIFECFIDTEDLQRLIDLNYSWCVTWYKNPNTYYVRTNKYLKNGKVEIILLHRLIMNAGKDDHVHHKLHNGLDNRKYNLIKTSNSKNNQHRRGKNVNNKSGYRNVFWNSSRNKWQVSICKNYKRIIIGYFDDVDEAGRVAEEARQQYFGEWAGEG